MRAIPLLEDEPVPKYLRKKGENILHKNKKTFARRPAHADMSLASLTVVQTSLIALLQYLEAGAVDLRQPKQRLRFAL